MLYNQRIIFKFDLFILIFFKNLVSKRRLSKKINWTTKKVDIDADNDEDRKSKIDFSIGETAEKIIKDGTFFFSKLFFLNS